MYAIVETGGKQYKAAVGDLLEVELLGQDTGAEVVFDKVLLVRDDQGTRVGLPYVEGAVVRGQVADADVAGKKVIVFKMKRRKDYRRKHGHRQHHTQVRVTAIEG